MKFLAFGQPQQQQQQQQQTSIFGNTNTTGTSSLFGAQSQASAFGAAKPTAFGFGQPQQASTSLLSSTPAQTSLWGQTATTNTAGGGLFGSPSTSGFGQPSVGGQQNGTAVAKFQPPQETDTLMKGSTTSYVQTKQQCITFMKEYAERSLEELRIEDYAANRKGPQAGAGTSLFGGNQQGGAFGSTMQQQQPQNSLFGAQQNTQPTTGLFGSSSNAMGGTGVGTFGASTSTFGQPNTGGLFGKPMMAPATTTSAFTAFGASTSTFGAAKPFGAVQATPNTGLFGQSQAPAFGATSTNTFGTAPSFGQQQPAQNTGGLFGAPATSAAPSFGLGATSAPQTAFGFGSSNAQANTGLFGAQKPAFGNAAPAFGAAQPSTSTGFSGFGNTATAGGLFGNNQAKPTFGFGQPQPSGQPAVSFGQPAAGGLFGGGATTTGGLFGSSQPAGGLFGGANTSFGGGNTNMSFNQQQPGFFGG